ncbi:ribosome biogenesis GTPase Der [Acidiluteibacter ferrifornacis]|uniref:GTPase Der n=1 Tax=Acidiluteibacter ferrifornacis TaxID=2692424 RepID=A0A6N9NN75_9FLAO|nr:ribosome biogenesis GTPase Der [Acidiluteibacter ferrifornacis]MBR9830522.1 ribosome biogenesis GTPase Der [bacterium]NBG66537.1 ribosome biogenesis GTPase Der [Acidiluteibacter ferrifornacis]
MANIVAIVGRPNVGKSTLFNRITESRKAIVDEQSGVTRDRHHGHANWSGREFTIIDTGGYISGSEDVFEGEIRKQVEISIQEANIILFVVDVTAGITDLDDVVADMLRKSGKKVFVIANKVDNNERWGESAVFHSFGLGAPYNISSLSGSGTGDLLDAVIAEFHDGDEEELDIPKFAIVGRPNVGKSSLVNALIGKEKNIVTDIAGTTRDALGTRYNAYGFDFMLTDTAGLRKKGKVDEDVEFYSVMRSIRAIENSDVCILLIEADKGVMAQDLNILQLALKNKKGLVIMVNKWDLIADKGSNTMRDFKNAILEKIAPFNDVPIIFTSVTEKQRIFNVLEEAVHVYQNRIRKIPTNKLNKVMLPIIEAVPPPAVKGKYIKIKFVNMLPTFKPTFVFYCNLPQYIKESYKRFLENKLREQFDYTGVPIQLFFREK